MISIDSISTSARKISSPYTWSHTVGVNASLIVVTTAIHSGGSGRNVSSCTCGSLSLVQGATDNQSQVEIWFGVNPPSGAQTITVNWTQNPGEGACGAATFFGVDTANPWHANVIGNTSGLPTLTVDCLAGGVVVDALYSQTSSAVAVGQAGQNSIHNIALTGNNTKSASSYLIPTGSGSTTLSWTVSDSHGYIGASFNPAISGGAFLLNML